MGKNIYREALELLKKRNKDLTSEDIDLINLAVFPAIMFLPKIDKQCDEMTITELLGEMAELMEKSSLKGG